MLGKVKRLLKKEKTIVTYGSYTLLINILGTIISIGTNLPLSTILGPAGFGTLKIINSFFTRIPIELGINTTIPKYLPHWESQGKIGKIKYLLRSFFLLRLGLVVVLSLIFFTFRKVLALRLLKDPTEAYLINLGIVFFALSYLDLVRPAILGFRNYKLHINASFLITILKSIFSLTFALVFGVIGALVASSLALILGIIPALNYLIKKDLFRTPPIPVNVGKIFKNYSLPVYLVDLTGLLGRFTTPLLAILFTRETIGYYSFALMIGSFISLVSGAMGQIFFPEVALEHSRNGETASFQKFRRVLLVFFLACSVLIPLGILISPPLISHLAPDYSPAIPIVKCFFFFYALIGSLSLILSYYMAIGKNKIAAVVRFISAFCNFSLSYLILKAAGL